MRVHVVCDHGAAVCQAGLRELQPEGLQPGGLPDQRHVLRLQRVKENDFFYLGTKWWAFKCGIRQYTVAVRHSAANMSEVAASFVV